MRVLKFGGSSVGSTGAINRVINIIKGYPSDDVAVIVVSAFSDMTDSLIEVSRKAQAEGVGYMEQTRTMEQQHCDIAAFFLSGESLESANLFIEASFAELTHILDSIATLRELSKRTLDMVMSFGERLSAALLARILSTAGIPADYLDTRSLIKTDADYGKALVLETETCANIRACFAETGQRLKVATGFIGSTLNGVTTTLGRGGSDLSAAIFAAALKTEHPLEIWTDVDGILTADPRLVKGAFTLNSLSYVEAMELSHFGAKVLFPPTIRPALEKGIPIWIRNTFNPAAAGTRIVQSAEPGPYLIRGITSINNVALIRVQGSGMVGVAGFSSRLFGALACKGINIILITQSSSEYSICFAILPEDLPTADAALREAFSREIATSLIDPPICEYGFAIIAVVGSCMKSSSGIAGKVFYALGRNGINVIAIAQGSSELNISAVIAQQDEAKALNALHEAFFLSGVRSVNLFLMGTGLIGGTLLEQLSFHRETLASKYKIRVNVVGVANSRCMLFREKGIDPNAAKIALNTAEDRETFSLPRFIERMKGFNLPNTAFCDCTASDDVAACYAEVLRSSIPIVTPNKRANAGSCEYYKMLTSYSRNRGIPYLYETTVCAGLPVISTLRDLTLSGDKVRRIEAVLSGTLSFIFNNYDGSKCFSALVHEAKAKGYTEPDPRDDLNAMDAARKALILARECGLPLEFSAVEIEPILPESCFAAPSIDAFFAELEKLDDSFERRRAEAAAEAKALRYIAVIEEGSARLALRSEEPASPFRSLRDSDNIVVITTDRYSTLPMVIKGPGAGAAVTAGGVFADIVRMARTLV
ncbi:MAG: bifunctional aspartate kinase/homoserine dehydrogenase I [Treponema sp.]|jgi:aspartokinase/homoserine dehydrogenase 1|nr:bifunctional aspartate kinase/homoserine dehydrogenase I [Treponema sp.]